MIVSMLFIIITVAYILYTYVSNRNSKIKLVCIKSEKSLPFVGHAFKLGKTEDEFLPALENMWIRMGRDKFILKLGTMHQIVLTKPQDIEVILSSSTLVNKSSIYKKIITAIAGNSSLVLDREQWRHFREITNEAFSFKILDFYVDIFQKEQKDLIDIISANKNKDLNILPIFNYKALNAISRAAIGNENILSNEENYQFINSLHQVLESVNKRTLSWWKSIDLLYNFSADSKIFYKNFTIMRNIIKKILDKKKTDLKDLTEKVNFRKENIESITKTKKNSMRNFSFIELLLLSRKENNQPLTDEEMLDEINLFIAAGYETTSNATSFSAYNLSLHPEVQEKAYQEQVSITDSNFTNPITHRDLNEMKYLERVIKESIRIFPPVVFFGRKITEKTLLPDGVELPIGSDVFLSPFLSHRDPEVFSDPEKFDPDRFLKYISNYMFFPFSAGPRNCVGWKMGMLETKFWLATVLRNFKLSPSNATPPTLVARVGLTSSNGIHVRCVKREN